MTHDLSFKREAAYVNGRWIAADSGKTFAVTNPANGETLGTARLRESGNRARCRSGRRGPARMAGEDGQGARQSPASAC